MPEAATLADLVAEVAARDGARPAVIFRDTTLSYADLTTLIERAADALAARGVHQGDRVALMLPNIPQFIIAYYAAARLGAITVPLNVLYKRDEIAYILNDCSAGTLIFFEGFAAQALPAAAAAPSINLLVMAGDAAVEPPAVSWNALLDGNAPPRPPIAVQPADVAVICYTSGTTGRSKGAMLTHRNFIANCEQLDHLPLICTRDDDRTLLVLPLFHIYAMNCAMNATLRAGSPIVLMPRFETLPVLEAIQRYRCTILHGAPPMYVAWVNTPELSQYDLSSLRLVCSGAAALPRHVLDRFHELTGITIYEGYGLTETAPVTNTNAAGTYPKPGAIGPAIPGVEIRLVDDEDRDVPPGAEGELICRGENVMAGYWNQPEATAAALRGGWFHTGDIATVDADGYYTIVDRKKDMINAGGFKIWPREVEDLLFTHPAVREAAVVAYPDHYAGERPLAFVALKEGASASAEEIIAFCKSHLATFKAPVRVEFRDELPKLPTGKVLRRVLREEARQLPALEVPIH